MATSPQPIGSFRRFFLNGGRLGIPLAECADVSVAFYLACALTDAVNGRPRLGRLSTLIQEAQKRNLGDEMLAVALRRRAELQQG